MPQSFRLAGIVASCQSRTLRGPINWFQRISNPSCSKKNRGNKNSFPTGSMYGIVTYIYHKFDLNMEFLPTFAQPKIWPKYSIHGTSVFLDSQGICQTHDKKSVHCKVLVVWSLNWLMNGGKMVREVSWHRKLSGVKSRFIYVKGTLP